MGASYCHSSKITEVFWALILVSTSIAVGDSTGLSSNASIMGTICCMGLGELVVFYPSTNWF